MKVAMLVFLLGCQLSFAETIKAKKVKEEMLSRVETLVTKINESREALDKEDVATTCDRIDELFKILPDHLMGIGTRMDLLDGAVIRMEQESKMFLIYVHQQKNICGTGERGENLQLKETDRKLKAMKKALLKQRKKIEKSDTSFENTYRYYYEFH